MEHELLEKYASGTLYEWVNAITSRGKVNAIYFPHPTICVDSIISILNVRWCAPVRPEPYFDKIGGSFHGIPNNVMPCICQFQWLGAQASRSYRDAPAASIIIKVRPKAARIAELNATAFIIWRARVTVITDGFTAERPSKHVTIVIKMAYPFSARKAGIVHPE